MQDNYFLFIKDLFYKKEYQLIFENFKKNKFTKSNEIIKIYLETLEILNKNFYLLELVEDLRLEYTIFKDSYSLEQINYLLLKACLDCVDIDKFKYYRENFENNNYSPEEFKELYTNFFSDKYLEKVENNIIENNSIDSFIILSRFYILKNDYKSAFDNYINTLQKAFILNDNYYIEIIYSDLLKYYKLLNIDNELYYEILSETENSNNNIFNYLIGLNEFYNCDFKKSSEYLIKLNNINRDLNLDYYRYKAKYILKIINYLNSDDKRIFNEIVKLIFENFSYFEIKILLESLFEKKNILFFPILKKFLNYNFNMIDLELLNNESNLFYKPKILISNNYFNEIEKELDIFSNNINIYFDGLALYGELVYIISYLAFKNININVYFNPEQNNFLSSKSENIFNYIKNIKFLNPIFFSKDKTNIAIDLAFINTDFIDNFDESKIKNIKKTLLYSSNKGLKKIIG